MKKMIQMLALALAIAAPAMAAAPAQAASQDAGVRSYNVAYVHNHHRYQHRSAHRVCRHHHCHTAYRYW